MNRSMKLLLSLSALVGAAWFGYSAFSARDEPEKIIDISDVEDVVSLPEQNSSVSNVPFHSPSESCALETPLEEKSALEGMLTTVEDPDSSARGEKEADALTITSEGLYNILLHGTNEELINALRLHDPEVEYVMGNDVTHHDALLRRDYETVLLHLLERGYYRIAAYYGEGAGIPLEKLRVLVANGRERNALSNFELKHAAVEGSDEEFRYALHAGRARNIAAELPNDPELLSTLERELLGLTVDDIVRTFQPLTTRLDIDRYAALKPSIGKALSDALDQRASTDYRPVVKILSDFDFGPLLPPQHFRKYIEAKIDLALGEEKEGFKLNGLTAALIDLRTASPEKRNLALEERLGTLITETIERISFQDYASQFFNSCVYWDNTVERRFTSPEAQRRIAFAYAQLWVQCAQERLDTEEDEYIRNAGVIKNLLDAMKAYAAVDAQEEIARISERILAFPDKWFGVFNSSSIPEEFEKHYPQFDAKLRQRCTIGNEIWAEERERKREEGNDEEEFQMPTESGY